MFRCMAAILFPQLLLPAGKYPAPAPGHFRRAINYPHGLETVFKLLLTPF